VEIRRFLSIPVLVDGKIVAAVGLANREEDYEDADVYELTLLMTGVWNDIKRREALSRLSFERARYFQTLVSIGDGVMVTDAEGKIEILNKAAEEITGWKTAEAAGKRYPDVFHVRFATGDPFDPIAEALRTGAVASICQEAVLVARDGTERALEDSVAPIRDETGKIAGAVLVFRDVTQKRAQMREITYQSFHDALTGLYNRRYLTEAVARLDAEENLPLAVVMGDLNGLKLTNDVFGHAAGDLLLEKIAAVLKRAARPEDVIGRWGGDEFLALLPRTDGAGAAEFISRVREAFAKERVRVIKGSISMGYACKERPEASAQVVFSMAEDAMYNAKAFERDETFRSTVAEVIRSLHQMSPREKAHSDAVRALSVRIAEALNLPPEEIRKIGEAGYLHDIGKIVLGAETLDESHPLTDLEWNEVRRHPIVGYRILNAFDDTMDIAEPVLAHHERWDGLGYPRGLKGDQIPLLARILAVAEACDRMVRDGIGPDVSGPCEVIRELRLNAGTQFDPMIVDALARPFEAGDTVVLSQAPLKSERPQEAHAVTK
jgi:diguanylate cyclase (GGDEF)-like protein/PAS domain S-box-containing protein